MYSFPEGIGLTVTPLGNSVWSSSGLTVGRTMQSPPDWRKKEVIREREKYAYDKHNSKRQRRPRVFPSFAARCFQFPVREIE